MSIRAVLMWYLGALVIVGGSGAAGYSAIKQHRALLAEQATARPAEQVAETPATPPATPMAAAAVQPPAATPAPHPGPTAATKTAAAPLGHPWPPLATPVATAAVEAPVVPAWAAESQRPRPSLPKAVAAHVTVRKHTSHSEVASWRRPVVHPKLPRRPAVYAAAHPPSAPRVTYYAYPGYYPYQQGYPYYSYYPRYYSTY